MTSPNNSQNDTELREQIREAIYDLAYDHLQEPAICNGTIKIMDRIDTLIADREREAVERAYEEWHGNTGL